MITTPIGAFYEQNIRFDRLSARNKRGITRIKVSGKQNCVRGSFYVEHGSTRDMTC
jgi:hypothetical protein